MSNRSAGVIIITVIQWANSVVSRRSDVHEPPEQALDFADFLRRHGGEWCGVYDGKAIALLYLHELTIPRRSWLNIFECSWNEERKRIDDQRADVQHYFIYRPFFLGKWMIGCDWRFFWWLLITQVPKSKCQFLLVRFMRRLMDMNFAKLARDQWPLRAFQVWTVKRICQHLDTRYHFIEDWIILLGLSWFVGGWN